MTPEIIEAVERVKEAERLLSKARMIYHDELRDGDLTRAKAIRRVVTEQEQQVQAEKDHLVMVTIREVECGQYDYAS